MRKKTKNELEEKICLKIINLVQSRFVDLRKIVCFVIHFLSQSNLFSSKTKN